MTLTIGTGPFGRRSAGVFNADLSAPEHLLFFEDSPRRVRAVFAGRTVADSTRVKLLHETEHLPVYYFPLEDVRSDLLERSAHSTRCPAKGQASYWSVVVGDRRAEDVMWAYERPLESAEWLAGYAAFYWSAMDAWYEEDEEVFVHPRDPYHRVDIRPSSRHVRVSRDGVLLAESTRPVLLFETGLPVRYYLPEADVRTELLSPSEATTRCPYKGVAGYRSVHTGGGARPDLVWTYPDPIREAEPIRGLLCFYNERVDLEVDGIPQERPKTRFS